MFSNGINYKVDGEGEIVVLIHGLSDSLEYWESFVKYLDDDFRVVRYDLRGHGHSPLSEGNISISTFVDDLSGLLDELDVERAHFVGFSLGGVIALEFAFNYPEKVSSLVLMSSFAGGQAHINGILEDLKKEVMIGFDNFYDFILPMVLCPDVIEDNLDELEVVKEYARGIVNTDAVVKAVDAMLYYDRSDDLVNINAPTLILAGRYDDFVPVAVQRSMHDCIPDSSFVVVDQVKHNLLIGDNLVKVADFVKDFLS